MTLSNQYNTKHGTAKLTAAFRTILALTVALAASPPAFAAPADTTAKKAAPAAAATPRLTVPIPYSVPPSLAVPRVEDETGRTTVADTLQFPWPPLDSADAARAAAAKEAAAAKKAAPVDTSVKIIHIDTVKALSADTLPAEPSVEPKAAPAAPPPVKRPRTRQELNKLSREELFRLAFGRSAPDKPRNLTVRLFGEGRPVGNTEINYNENFTAFTFRSMPFSRLLDRMIRPEARAAAGDSLGHFDSETLTAAGYVLVVDDIKFELRVTFPPYDKAVQFTYLYGGYRINEPRGEEILPALVSFYINYSMDDRARFLRYGNNPASGRWYGGGDTLIRDPATINVDGALNLREWVFESSGWVREPYGGQPFTWENIRRDDARAVRNFVKLRSQLTLGDITAGTPIVSGPMTGGARYERNSYFFGNNPHDNLNSVTFFMPEPGEVEVYMDGAFRRRIYLPAGHHQLGGFDGDVGRNRVRLLLRMASGAVEEVPFEFILSHPRVMARGDVRYSLSAGIRREYAPSPACFTYNTNEPVASVDYAYGIHHAVNTGFSAVATRHAARGGMQASFGLGGLGFVDLRGIVSYLVVDSIAGKPLERNVVGERIEGSYTADLGRPVARFNRFVTGDPNGTFLPDMSFAARGYYRTERYSVRLFNEPSGGVDGNVGGVSGNFAFALWRGNLSAFAGMNFYRETGFETDFYPTDYDYGVRLSQGFGRSYFSASAGESVRGRVRSPYFSLNTSHAFGTGFNVRSHRFSASVNAGMSSRYIPTMSEDTAAERPDSMEFDWSYGGALGWSWSNNTTSFGTQDYAAGITFVNDQTPSASASLRHVYNRAQMNAYYDLAFGDHNYDRQTHAIRALFTGSLMFADGLWALGQRMSSGGGFVLVDTRGDLNSAKVYINRSRETGMGQSHSGLLGAAYHNRLMAYTPTELTLSLTDVPVGAFMEQSRYYVTGTYKQGFALRIGKKAQVVALVPFVEKRGGKPLGHTYLTIEADADENEDGADNARAAFTNENGVLQTGGLTPGYRYRVKFRESSRLKDALIDIPDDANGMYEHPVVEVERED
ncbi:MAG: hypothetical protein LBB74_02900 [Chitinispirillales bacterium]|jgi:outer membrane usher protein FimD/PapC|nr:hypothetical protein [Chitinispirillales bacterium]